MGSIPNIKRLVTSGDITQFVSLNSNAPYVTINKEFDIEYIVVSRSSLEYTIYSTRTTITKHSIYFNADYYRFGFVDGPSGSGYSSISINSELNTVDVAVSQVTNASPLHTADIESTITVGRYYRLYS